MTYAYTGDTDVAGLEIRHQFFGAGLSVVQRRVGYVDGARASS